MICFPFQAIVKPVVYTKGGFSQEKKIPKPNPHQNSSHPKRYTEICPQAASSLPSSSKQEDNLQEVIKDQYTSDSYRYLLYKKTKASKEKED